MKLDKQVIPVAALVVFTCLVVTIAISSLGRSRKPEQSKPTIVEHVSIPAPITAQHSAPAPAPVLKKAPVVSDSRPPEPALAPQTPAPGSHLTRPEPAVADSKPAVPALTSAPVHDEKKEQKEEKKETKVPAAQSNAAPPSVADDTDGPPPVTTSKEFVWIEDALPAGARGIKESNEEWIWVKQDPAPFSGTLAHQSTIQNGTHQHSFRDANPGLKVEAGDVLTAYVFIDPAHPPAEIMLQWHAGEGYFNHRAYWGANKIEWGSDSSPTRRNMGALPPPGQWVLLQVPAAQIGLEGLTVTGMSFTIFDGRATWDRIGKIPKTAATEKTQAAVVVPQQAQKPNVPAVVKNPKEEYEKTLIVAYAKLSSDTVDRTIFDLEKIASDPQYAEVSENVREDLGCVRGYKEFLAAASKGMTMIGAQRSFKLKTIDGKETLIAADKHCSVKEVKDGALWIEEEMGGASATRKLAFEQLSAQTLYELATLALPSGAASDLKLGFAGYIAQLNNGTIPVSELRTRLENASKDEAIAKAAARVLEKLNATINDQAMNAAMKRIESAIKGKDFALGKSLLKDFKRDFGWMGTPTVNDFIDKASFDMADLKPGLWASYYCGDETNPARKYLFSRAETKLFFNWGRGSPDPRVPKDFFTIRFNGLLRARTAGTYTFMASADDLLEMSIDGKKVLNVTWHTDGEAGKNCAVKLNAGDHELRIVFKQYLVDSFMNVKWKLDNESKWQDVPESMLWHDPRLVEKYQKDAF